MTEFIHQLTSNFHFLRVGVLWGLIPVGILALLLFQKTGSEEKWKKTLPGHLAEHLIVQGRENSRWPRLLMVVALFLAVFAAAGPTWKEIDRGEVKTRSSLVIALDLSRSMLATDLQPNRLERAKNKIVDLLNELPGLPTALIGFAGTAHTVIPFTTDYHTLAYLLEHVSPGVMPVKGTNFGAVFALADSLLKPLEMPGSLLIVTDDLPLEELSAVQDFASNTRAAVQFLLISTPSGAPIPISKNAFLKDSKGNTVIPALHTGAIKTFARLKGVHVNLVTLDDSDIRKIVGGVKENLAYEEKENEENKEWEDLGYWFMIPAGLILLFWFRKGWVVTWMLLLFAFHGFGCSSQNEMEANAKAKFEFIDLWLTKDQQAQKLFDAGKYLQAAEKFENPYWKGVAYYKAREFQLAAQSFYQIKTPESYYNIGMCMAELENWNEANFAFEEALKMNPDFAEARHNLAEIKKLIPKKKKIELVTPQSFEDRMFGQSEELDQESSEEGDKEETGGGEQQLENELAQQMQPGGEQMTFPETPEQQQQEQKDILLKQMSDDPAVFLKRKFQMQYRKIAKKIKRPAKKW